MNGTLSTWTAPRRGPGRKIARTLLIGGLLLGPVALAPARAQMAYGFARLHPVEVVDLLRDQGFRRLSRPVSNRDVYVLDALDPYNVPVRLIVSAHTGDIVEVFRQRGLSTVEVDPDDDEAVDRHLPPARDAVRPARPERQATLPPVVKEAPPRTTNPALTPKSPTVVKRSPLAIPKEDGPGAATAPSANLPGTRSSPRVIPMTPEVKTPATTAAPAPAEPPKAALAPEPQSMPMAPPPSDTQLPSAPPPAVLDYRGGRTGQDGGMVPPAPLD
jgi:hypothetical protein